MAITGAAGIRRRLRVIRRNVDRTIDEALDELAAEIHAKSNDFAPQLTGAMIRESGVDAEDRAGRFRRSVFYKLNYAVFQHEGNFNPGPITASKSSAGRKFLSRAFQQKARRGIRDVGRKIERSLRFAVR